jgi:hypothetical protein
MLGIFTLSFIFHLLLWYAADYPQPKGGYSCGAAGLGKGRIVVAKVDHRHGDVARGCSWQAGGVRPVFYKLPMIHRQSGKAVLSVFNCLIVALSAIVILCNPVAARAATDGWSQLADGRVLIKIKDGQLALPSAGSDINLVSFTDRQSGMRLLLKDIISAPVDARSFFSNAKTIIVNIPDVLDRSDLFLHRFNRSDFQSFDADFVFGEGAQGNCKAWEQNFSELKSDAAKGGYSAAIDGWTEFSNGSHPTVAAYVRVGESGGEQKFVGALSCDATGMCHVSRCIGRGIGVYYQFSKKVFDRGKWDLINDRARDLIDFVLIESEK